MTHVLATTPDLNDNLFDLSMLMQDGVREVYFTKADARYKTAKPLAANPLPDDMLRVYTDDGVAHTIRPWYTAIVLVFDDGREQSINLPERTLTTSYTSVSLIPSGIRRIYAGITGLQQVEGPMWFHYGGLIGFSNNEDVNKALSDYDGYSRIDSQNGVFWWRDEPENAYFF